MMRRSGRTSASLLVLLAMSAPPVGADPIAAVFDVQVLEKLAQRTGGISMTEPFNQHFVLSMTFNPAQSRGGSGIYGLPSFSPVPLDVPPAPDALSPLRRFGSTTHIEAEGGGFFAQAQAGLLGQELIDDIPTLYAVQVILRGFEPGASVRAPETFPAHLATPSAGFPFNFIYDACLGSDFPASADACNDARNLNAVTYRGRATLREAGEPIPEPSTFVLVGGGLALIKWRKRFSRRWRPGPFSIPE